MQRPIIFFALVLILLGCSQSDMIKRFAPAEDQATAKHYIELLRQNRFDEIEREVDPSIRGQLHSVFGRMAAAFPPGEPTSVTVVGARQGYTPKSSSINLTFEYQFADKWLLTNVAIKKEDGKTSIIGFNVYPESCSLEEQNKFTFVGKTPLHYLIFSLVVALPLFTLFILIDCIRTKMKGKKWPWILFIIVGFGNFAINWSTGKWLFLPLSFQLFSGSAVAQFYGPWTLAVSIPIGAIVWLFMKNKLRAIPESI